MIREGFLEKVTSELWVDVKDKEQRGQGREGLQAVKLERIEQT